MKHFFCFFIGFCFLFNAYSQGTIQPAGPTTFCVGGSVMLRINGAAAGSTYQWTKDGTNVPGAVAVTYTATTNGSYSTVVTTAGTPTTLTPVIVTVIIPPVANFTFTTNNQCSSVPIAFTNNSASGLSYLWSFGDPNSGTNNTSTDKDPIHRFKGTSGNGTQNFSVRLTATDSYGCTGTQSATISTKQSPDTTLGGTGFTTYQGLPYFRQCQSISSVFNFTNPLQANKVAYKIIWGDDTPDFNATSFITTPHTYAVGTHTLQYIVTGSNGCVDTGSNYVFVGENPSVGLAGGANNICEGTRLTFSIDQTETSKNTAGTTYILSFNDKTPSVILPHPPPLTVSHTFDTTSCGAPVTGTYNNSFFFSIVASNACGNKEGLFRPIYVSSKPVAAYTISPNDTTCVGTAMTFTNTSLNRNIDNNGVCSDGNGVWSILPSSGWSLTGGSRRGDDFGLADPSTWDPGSKNLTLNFTAPGTYAVKLKIGNGTCGSDSIVKTICVNPAPTAAFIIDKDTGCAPFQVTATSAPATAMSCGNSTYSWSVQYIRTTGCLPDTASYTYINGTSPNSLNPQFRFLNPGSYTIRLTVFGPGNTCSTTAQVKTVIVKGKPSVSITSPASVCTGTPFNPAATANCYITQATYAWSFPGGNPSSSPLLKPDTIRYPSPGSYSIQLTASNECGDTNVNKLLTVNDMPIAVAGETQSICGTSATMKATPPVNATGGWSRVSGPTSFNITTPASPTTTITGLVAGTYVFKWEITNASCTTSANVTIVVTPGGISAIAGPDQKVCIPNPVTLNGNNPNPGTGLWTRVSGPNIPVITNDRSPSTTVTGTVAGTYVFRWSISNGNCSASADDVQVIIDDSVTTASAGVTQNICGTTTTLAANTPVIGSGQWTMISGPNTPTITNPFVPNTTITGLIPGNYMFRWTITNGVCSTFATVNVVVASGATTAIAGKDRVVCRTTSLSLEGNTPVAGTGTWTKVSGPNTPAFTTDSSPTTTVTGLIPGTYVFRWTITFSTCPPNHDDVQITVQNLKAAFTPQGIITCKTDTTILHQSDIVYTGNDQLQYKWVINNQTISTGATLSYRYLLPAGSTLPYSFNTSMIVTNTAGCADTARGAVVIQQSVKASFDLVNSNTCVPFVLQVSNTSVNAVSYKWLINGLQVSTAPSPVLPISLPSTPYTVTLIADNNAGCKPDTFSRTFRTPATPEALFTVNESVGCDGFLNIAINNQTTGADNYTWIWSDGTPNSNFSNPTHLYNVIGKYPVILIAGNGVCTDTAIVNVQITKKPLVNFSTDKSNDCDSVRVSFTNLSTPVNNFLWYFGDGTTSTTNNPVKTFAPRVTPYTVKLVATDALGCKDSATKPNLITAQLPPAANFLVSPRAVIEVPDHTFNFINTTPQNNNYRYTWNFGDGAFPENTRNASHRYKDTGKYVVSLTVFDNTTNCSKTVSQGVQITGFAGYLFVPNAFQPSNTNPLLKTFLPVGKGLCRYRLQIFTTWGQKVFETVSLDNRGTPNEGWNGLYNGSNTYNQGKTVQQDNYIWRIDAYFKNGNDCSNPVEWKGMEYPNETQLKRVGSITLIR